MAYKKSADYAVFKKQLRKENVAVFRDSIATIAAKIFRINIAGTNL